MSEAVVPHILDPGEHLIWSGRASPFEYAVDKCTLLVPVGLFFIFLFTLWVTGQATLLNFPFLPFGISVLGTGLYVLIALPWYCWRGVRARYFLTNRRAIIEILPPFPQHVSVPLGQVQFVEIKKRSWGRGSVLFKTEVTGGADTDVIKGDGFVAIRDTDRVAGLLRAAIDNALHANETAL